MYKGLNNFIALFVEWSIVIDLIKLLFR